VAVAVIAGALLAPSVGAAPAQARPRLPVTVDNADGGTTTVADVSRIVSLNGDITEVIFALGLGDSVVATDTSATYPAAAAALPKIGYQRSLNAEGILSFSPTVVIGNVDAGPPPVIQQLRDASVPVVILPVETTRQAPMDKIEAVATALGVPERGEALSAKTGRAIRKAEKLARRSSDEPRAVLLYLRGPTTQLIAGTGTGFDTMLRSAHATDAAAEAGLEGFVPITAEGLVAAAPDVIVVTTSGLESVGGIDGLLQVPGVAQTPAGAAKSVLDYDDQKLLGGGPRTGAALRELVLDLHPQLARQG
jgi:iron complex transport system substrate-binding protein